MCSSKRKYIQISPLGDPIQVYLILYQHSILTKDLGFHFNGIYQIYLLGIVSIELKKQLI